VDLLLAQEAHPNSLEALCREAGLDWYHSARSAFPKLISERGHERARSVAIAGRGSGPSRIEPIDDLEFVEKAAHTELDIGVGRVTVATYHAPAGVTHGVGKPRQAVRFTRWLAEREGPTIMGGDFNTPEVDHPDANKLRTHWHTGTVKLKGEPGDDVLVGPRPTHALRDAYRAWLDDHRSVLGKIRAERPEGPLAVTYCTGKNGLYPKRYDAIWVTPHFSVLKVEHFYEESVEIRLDHGLVIATLELPGSGLHTK
jgi:hypothetical protein